MRKLLLVLSLFVWISSIKAQSNIAEARAMTAGTTVTVTGIVINGSELGNIRYIQDNTAGIGVYSATNTTLLSAVRGDEITVTGVLKNYNSLLELDPITTVTINSQNNTLPAPQVVTPLGIDETTEGELAKVLHCTISATGNFAANTNYTFYSGSEYRQLRIVTTCPLVGQPIPTGVVSLTGVGSQYSTTGTGGYQLLIRDANDITLESGIYINSPLSSTNITTSGMTINWTTNISGTSQAKYGRTPALELGILNGTGGSTSHSVDITGANPAELYYVNAFSTANGDTAYSGTQVFITRSLSDGDMKAYFSLSTDHTVSTGTNAITLGNLIDDTLINYINRTKYTLDIAIYNYSTTNMADIAGAINAAYNRGVTVRVIYESSSTNTGIDALNPAIGKIARTSSSGIMHNKFVVIDAYSNNPNDAIVWTGSTNWTTNQINTDANNVIIIRDQSLAKAYELEFNEMYGSTGTQPNSSLAKFGASKTDNTPHEFVIGGSRVELYFSPSDSVNSEILRTMGTADDELYVETNLITKSNIGYEIRDIAQAGATTKVLVSDDGLCSATVVSTLISALGNNFKNYTEGGILHHKLMIVDPNFTSADPLVWTGSHNWSASADEDNDENSLVIHNALIANLYYQEFVKRFGNGAVVVTADKISADENALVYPNPSTSEFLIILSGNASNATYTLYNMQGQSQLTGVLNGNQANVEVPSLPRGVYILKVKSDKTNLTKKIVLN